MSDSEDIVTVSSESTGMANGKEFLQKNAGERALIELQRRCRTTLSEYACPPNISVGFACPEAVRKLCAGGKTGSRTTGLNSGKGAVAGSQAAAAKRRSFFGSDRARL